MGQARATASASAASAVKTGGFPGGPDHGLDLPLVRPAVSHHRLLDLQGLISWTSGLFPLPPGARPPGLPEEHGAFHVLAEKGAFHGHEAGFRGFNQAGESAEDLL
jgi:hypothetical protein